MPDVEKNGEERFRARGADALMKKSGRKAVNKNIARRAADTDFQYRCEWLDCGHVALSMNEFNHHVSAHRRGYTRDIEKNPNSAGFAFFCAWNDCNAQIQGQVQDFARHVFYHTFHQYLKHLGQHVLKFENLPECSLGGLSRNLVPELPEELKCRWKDCGVVFDNPYVFYSHVCHHTEIDGLDRPKPPYRCQWEDCNTEVKVWYRLREHMRSHTQAKVVACPTCGSLFSNNTRLVDHIMRQTHSTGNFICSHCDAKLGSERILRDHMRHHVNNYKCPFCNMTCHSPSGIRDHIQYRHSDTRLYPCDQCPYRAKMFVDLHRHMNSCHKEKKTDQEATSGAEADVTADDDVSDDASNSSDASNTENEGRGRRRIFACHMCDKTYRRGHRMTQHLMYVHNFNWPSGHERFRYKKSNDNVYRLQTVRFESIEVSQQVLGQRLSPTPEDDGETQHHGNTCASVSSDHHAAPSVSAAANTGPLSAGGIDPARMSTPANASGSDAVDLDLGGEQPRPAPTPPVAGCEEPSGNSSVSREGLKKNAWKSRKRKGREGRGGTTVGMDEAAAVSEPAKGVGVSSEKRGSGPRSHDSPPEESGKRKTKTFGLKEKLRRVEQWSGVAHEEDVDSPQVSGKRRRTTKEAARGKSRDSSGHSVATRKSARARRPSRQKQLHEPPDCLENATDDSDLVSNASSTLYQLACSPNTDDSNGASSSVSTLYQLASQEDSTRLSDASTLYQLAASSTPRGETPPNPGLRPSAPDAVTDPRAQQVLSTPSQQGAAASRCFVAVDTLNTPEKHAPYRSPNSSFTSIKSAPTAEVQGSHPPFGSPNPFADFELTSRSKGSHLEDISQSASVLHIINLGDATQPAAFRDGTTPQAFSQGSNSGHSDSNPAKIFGDLANATSPISVEVFTLNSGTASSSGIVSSTSSFVPSQPWTWSTATSPHGVNAVPPSSHSSLTSATEENLASTEDSVSLSCFADLITFKTPVKNAYESRTAAVISGGHPQNPSDLPIVSLDQTLSRPGQALGQARHGFESGESLFSEKIQLGPALDSPNHDASPDDINSKPAMLEQSSLMGISASTCCEGEGDASLPAGKATASKTPVSRHSPSPPPLLTTRNSQHFFPYPSVMRRKVAVAANAERQGSVQDGEPNPAAYSAPQQINSGNRKWTTPEGSSANLIVPLVGDATGLERSGSVSPRRNPANLNNNNNNDDDDVCDSEETRTSNVSGPEVTQSQCINLFNVPPPDQENQAFPPLPSQATHIISPNTSSNSDPEFDHVLKDGARVDPRRSVHDDTAVHLDGMGRVRSSELSLVGVELPGSTLRVIAEIELPSSYIPVQGKEHDRLQEDDRIKLEENCQVNLGEFKEETNLVMSSTGMSITGTRLASLEAGSEGFTSERLSTAGPELIASEMKSSDTSDVIRGPGIKASSVSEPCSPAGGELHLAHSAFPEPAPGLRRECFASSSRDQLWNSSSGPVPSYPHPDTDSNSLGSHVALKRSIAPQPSHTSKSPSFEASADVNSHSHTAADPIEMEQKPFLLFQDVKVEAKKETNEDQTGQGADKVVGVQDQVASIRDKVGCSNTYIVKLVDGGHVDLSEAVVVHDQMDRGDSTASSQPVVDAGDGAGNNITDVLGRPGNAEAAGSGGLYGHEDDHRVGNDDQANNALYNLRMLGDVALNTTPVVTGGKAGRRRKASHRNRKGEGKIRESGQTDIAEGGLGLAEELDKKDCPQSDRLDSTICPEDQSATADPGDY